MATAHTRWWWKLGWDQYLAVFTTPTTLNNTSACWKIRQKKKNNTKNKSSLHSAIWNSNTEPESIKQHSLLLWLSREISGPLVILLPLYHFQCHTSERGGGLAFCSESCCSFVSQVRNMGVDFFQTIPTSVWIKARLRLCWVLFKLFTYSWNIEVLFARTLKGKHSGGIKKNGGTAATTKSNHSLLGLSLPIAIFYHVEMSGEQNGETEQKEQHLHV